MCVARGIVKEQDQQRDAAGDGACIALGGIFTVHRIVGEPRAFSITRL